MIYGELGAYPMSVYIKLCMVNYWSKLINGKDSKLSLTLYKYMYIKNSHGQYQSSWFDNVKIIVVSVISGSAREILIVHG